MNETTKSRFDSTERMTVDIDGLMELLGVGRKTATDIGTSAKARIQVNRRVLWNLKLIQKYLDALSE